MEKKNKSHSHGGLLTDEDNLYVHSAPTHCRRLAWLERGKRNHRPVQEKNKQCRKSENNINLTTAIAGRDPIRRCINFTSVPSPPDEDLIKGIGALGQEEVFRHPQ